MMPLSSDCFLKALDTNTYCVPLPGCLTNTSNQHIGYWAHSSCPLHSSCNNLDLPPKFLFLLWFCYQHSLLSLLSHIQPVSSGFSLHSFSTLSFSFHSYHPNEGLILSLFWVVYKEEVPSVGGSFWVWWNTLYLDRKMGYMGVHICQNLPNSMTRSVHYTACKL